MIYLYIIIEWVHLGWGRLIEYQLRYVDIEKGKKRQSEVMLDFEGTFIGNMHHLFSDE